MYMRYLPNLIFCSLKKIKRSTHARSKHEHAPCCTQNLDCRIYNTMRIVKIVSNVCIIQSIYV